MLSRAAFIVGDYLATGAFTLHDLRSTLTKVERVGVVEIEQVLKSALLELARTDLITWEYEPDYGNVPSVKPHSYDAESFLVDWNRCLGSAGLRDVVPDADNPTMLVEATEALIEELHRSEYDAYL